MNDARPGNLAGHPVATTSAAQSQGGAPATVLLDSVLQQMPCGVSLFGPDRRLAIVNAAYRRIMAGAPGDIGDTLDDIVQARFEAGEYVIADPQAYAARLREPVPGTFAHRRHRPDGTTIDVRITLLEDGSRLTVLTDTTALAVAEAELARRADLLASIVSHIPFGISVYGPDRRLRLLNGAYSTIMDGAPIAVGEHIDEIIERRARTGEYGPGDPAERAVAQRAHDKARPQFRRRQRPNGTFIDVRTAPLPDGGHISVVADITPLVTAERDAARRAETLDAMLANIRHGIVLWDKDGRIVTANPVAEALLGTPPGLLVSGRTLAEVTRSALERGNLGAGETARTRARWLLEQDRGMPHTDQRLTRDGRVLEVRSDPVATGGFVTTYTDVTQIREAEDALRLAKSAAEAANAAKSRFLAAMSAELRTPLGTILDHAEQLAREAADQTAADAGQRAHRTLDSGALAAAAAAIDESARSLLGMIDTILDVARLEAGRFDLADDTVDLAQLFRAVLRRFDAAAAAAEVSLIVDLPAGLPPLRADRPRLHQVLCHLVANALRHTDPLGSVSLAARLDWVRGGLHITVSDTGAGIPASELDRVFQPFVQLDPAAPAAGAGLGLYVSRTLMRAHGGDLTLAAAVPHGVVATMHLPADRVVQDRAPPPM